MILVIYGAAATAMEEMIEARRVVDRAVTMGVGLDVAAERIDFKWIVTLHPDEAQEIKDRRYNAGLPVVPVIGHEGRSGVDIVYPYEAPSGSSALHGVLWGLDNGYNRVVVCGCPLEGKNKSGTGYEQFRTGWEARKDRISENVRSMGGWTAELLGKPTTDWINNEGGK